LQTIAAPVLFFSGEDGAQVVLRRFHSLCKALSVAPADLEGKLLLLDASDIDPALHRDNRGVTETKLLGALSELVAKRHVGLVVVDNASDTFDDDEIKRARVRQFVRSLRSRIARPGRAVLLLAHVNKVSAIGGREAGREDYSGSTAWHNSVRSRLSLSVEKDEDCLTLEHQKANLGPRAKTIRLRWHDGVPLEDGSFTDVGAAANAAILAAERKKAADAAKIELIAMIKDFNSRGETVTTANTGPYSVWITLSKRAGFPKSVKTSSDLMDLLAEMQAEGSIHRAIFRTKDRKKKEVFVAGSAPMPDEKSENE
jgi:RecA-family ATPase